MLKKIKKLFKSIDNKFNFIYINLHHAAIAQLVERWTENPYVVSSTLTRGKKLKSFDFSFFFACLFFLFNSVKKTVSLV